MGLDMYLSKRTYIGAEYEHRKVKGEISITINEKPVNIKFNRVSEVIESVAYWRKANAIHNWFVKNIQEGNDDCGNYYVSKDQLQKLISDCADVISDNSKSAVLLPPKAGFFFGGTELDQYYFDDLKETIEMITPLLTEDGDYYYKSSW